jgi:hypothetical protein
MGTREFDEGGTEERNPRTINGCGSSEDTESSAFAPHSAAIPSLREGEHAVERIIDSFDG